ncbi:MAG TPA: serine hydrolase domain-containing protein [Thermotogota bacterium]|nr:serine hydrolase domain-containing protein [Thermotogota bacterium]HRW34774.1 serine hydrolase domain-containing protein [Thermotogota bacterium]
MNIKCLIEKDFTGVVSIIQKGKVLFQDAFGYADLPNKIPNEMDTKFPTASAGKAFVAVGIMKLIETGILDIDGCLSDLVNFDLKAIDPNISVRQLLNHTSGIPDYFDESVMDEYEELWIDYPNYKIRTSADLIPLFINKPMMYKPGEKFQYNNTGFVVLGLIIEAVTGKKFDEYLEETVFQPLGMTNTGYYELDRLPAKCANAYIFDESHRDYRTNIFSVDVKGTGAGGAFTTIPDVEKFWKELLSYQILSEKSVKEMMSPQVEEKCYGYGFWLDKKEDGLIVHFEGCDPGVSFYSAYDREKDLMITLVSNFGNNVWKLYEEINKHLYREFL